MAVQPPMASVPIILSTAFGADEWELNLPLDIPVQALIKRFLRESQLGFRETDDGGNAIPYRLMWKEGNRFLGESETLRGAGVQARHTVTMAHEARAGAARMAQRGQDGPR